MQKSKLFLACLAIFSFSACGSKEPEEHVHTFSENWSYDRKNHWHDSLCGDPVVDGKAEHDYGDWQIENQPTGDTPGTKYKKCAVCGYRSDRKSVV